MDFPIFHLDIIGDRLLIAIIGVLHVIINHGLAIGFIPLITILEYLGFRERKTDPGLGEKWDELAKKMMFTGFIITTTIGALTGVGIWFSAALVNPDAIGSLIRVFFNAWFAEWIVFILEVIFVMIYFLTWKKSTISETAKKRHIIFGAVLSVFSWMTMAIVTAILGFMMNPGSWLTRPSMLTGFTNPLYIPQLYFRTPVAMMLGGAFGLFLILFFLKKENPVRAKATSFISLWVLIWSPVALVGAILYRGAIPGKMMVNLPTALATQAFQQWYDSVIYIIVGAVLVSILIAMWGFLKPRALPRAFMVIPIIALCLLLGSFERAREFIRKPFMIGQYIYANGLRVENYGLYKKNGVLPYARYTSTREVTEKNKVEAGKNVFLITCSRCHTVTGINSVVKKFRRLAGAGQELKEESIINYIPKMHNVWYYMPPFPGNEKELGALARFIVEMDKIPRYLEGAQTGGIPKGSPHGKLTDIPLPQPLPPQILVVLLILSFLVHILFVNLMLGGSILTLWAEIKGLKNKSYDSLALEIANTITVNKSLAVVLGVAPLLLINTLYTVFFYSSNILTGGMWISIVPIVTAAFLLLYYHKYSWGKYENKKRTHLVIIGTAVFLLLFVPFIFLSNINLMLFPGKWEEVKGFFSAMMMRNVIPRYLHFLCASLAVTGLFLFGYMKRRGYDVMQHLPGFSRYTLLKKWYSLALIASLCQLGLGPLNLFTLPWHAVEPGLIYILVTGAAAAIAAIFMLWRELEGPETELGKYFIPIAAILTITVLLMGTGRHVYRAAALSPFQEKSSPKSSITGATDQRSTKTSKSHIGIVGAVVGLPFAYKITFQTENCCTKTINVDNNR